ncbi:MAG: non-heme iron oxygenase ferredoxin subunit [Alphaproteobacteria bacterium]
MTVSDDGTTTRAGEERWIAACAAADVEDDFGTRVEVDGGQAIAVFRVDGAYHATDDRCTHGEASLCEGLVDGNVVECPFHAGTFDIVTGKALTFPCVVNLATYPVRVEDGTIMVRVDAPTTIPTLLDRSEPA